MVVHAYGIPEILPSKEQKIKLLEGKYKLGQNKTENELKRIIRYLKQSTEKTRFDLAKIKKSVKVLND